MVKAFAVSELLREKQQGDGGKGRRVKITLSRPRSTILQPPTQIRVK